jgi:hypothetical protein
MDKTASPEEEKQEAETTSNVQVQNNIGNEEQADDALLSGEEVMHSDKGDDGAGEETTAVEQSAAEILAAAAPNLASKAVNDVNQNSDSVTQNGDSVNHSDQKRSKVRQKRNRASQNKHGRNTSSLAVMKGCRTTFTTQRTASADDVKDARVSDVLQRVMLRRPSSKNDLRCWIWATWCMLSLCSLNCWMQNLALNL